jgi:TolB-like protein/class 3 adenylate cyclase
MAEEPLRAEEQPRKLVAIMFTDMVGYTALTQQNEGLSLELLEEHQRLLRPLFAQYHGREIKTMGDAFHVEFASALEAVRCAIEIQKTLIEHNASSPPEKKIQIRIGIHLGDVTPRAQDIFGDAVNIASRIEPLAEPGGICISQQVYDQVHNKLDRPPISLGKHELKNVAAPLEVYRVVLPWEKRQIRDTAQRASRSPGKRALVVTVAALTMIILTGAYLWQSHKISTQVQANPPEKPRIAVLPLDNFSSDPQNQYFADGLTDELISTLSKISGLRVIARTSVMQYKQTKKTVAEIGQELQVGTVLEGSVQKEGDKARISVQLVDTRSQEHLWAEDYDNKLLGDVFAIESDVAERVAQALQVKLVGSEKQDVTNNPTDNPEAYDLYLLGQYFENQYTL